MRRLKIDAEELIMALESYGDEGTFFLDLQSGEVLPVIWEEGVSEENDELREQIDAGSERYRRIEPLPSSVGYSVMADFVETVPDSKIARRLGDALRKRHPFRRFKDALYDYPELREGWFRFHKREFTRLAGEWFEDEGIEAELIPPRNSDG